MVINLLRDRVVESTTSLFSHGPRPLENTLEHAPDPGLLGPDSVSWEVLGDTTAFVGGIRALLIQTAHPEVVAGVEDHSAYRVDPLGRLTRTSLYVTETTYGAMPEVEAAVAMVRRMHKGVSGRSDRGRLYAASQPALAAWVHNVLTDSFLRAYEAYGPRRLTPEEADRFVDEQARIGALLDADPLPRTSADLQAWILDHPDIEGGDQQRRAVRFLLNPPLSIPVRVGYGILLQAALATVPSPLAATLRLPKAPGQRQAGAAMVHAMRWALGASPSWHLALVRAGAPVRNGLFRQPLPDEAASFASGTTPFAAH
ncbi:MAG: oxygenase MpaB family protein [Actinomycetota bacterium]